VLARSRGPPSDTASREAIATRSRSELETTTTSWAQTNALCEMRTDAAPTFEPVTRSVCGSSAWVVGTSKMLVRHGRRSSVVVVAPAVLDVPPVPPPSVDPGVDEGLHAAITRDRTMAIVARRRCSSGFGERLTGGRTQETMSNGGWGSGGITGGTSQMCTGMPMNSCESSQSESHVFTRVHPCDAGYAGTS
jgi:hypothetical protein